MRKAFCAFLIVCGVTISGFAALLFYGPLETAQDRPLPELSLSEARRIVFLGTSLTADYDWPARFETCAKADISVVTVAKGGAGSDWGRDQLEAVSAIDPDIVFVEFAINDADLRLGISRRESLENHQAILHHLGDRHPDAEIVLMTMNSAHGLRRYLLRPRLPAYYALYRELAVEFETGLLDLYPRWRVLDKAARDQADGLHPSQSSAARVILPALSTYLAIPLDAACAALDQT